MADRSNQTNAGRGRGGGRGLGGGRGRGTTHNTGPDGSFNQPTPAGSRTGSRKPNQTSNPILSSAARPRQLGPLPSLPSISPSRPRPLGQIPSLPGMSPSRPRPLGTDPSSPGVSPSGPKTGQQQSPTQRSVDLEAIWRKYKDRNSEKQAALAVIDDLIKEAEALRKPEQTMMKNASIDEIILGAIMRDVLDRFEDYIPLESRHDGEANDQSRFDDGDGEGLDEFADSSEALYRAEDVFGEHDGGADGDFASDFGVQNTIEDYEAVKEETFEESDDVHEVDKKFGF